MKTRRLFNSVDFARQRQRMVERLSLDLALPEAIELALLRVPREEFVHEGYREEAYVDEALPLGFGATISQPSMIAIVLLELRLERGMRVQEAGSGCGYLLALLAAMGVSAVGVEIVPALVAESRATLTRLGVEAEVVEGDAARVELLKGFDRVVFSAAVPRVPAWAVARLSPNGFVLAPVGSGDGQELVRAGPGFEERTGRLCRFVPFV